MQVALCAHVASLFRVPLRFFPPCSTFQSPPLSPSRPPPRRVKAEIASNPPLGYEVDEASHLFFQGAKQEIQESRQEGLFDSWIDNGMSTAAAFTQFSEALHLHYPGEASGVCGVCMRGGDGGSEEERRWKRIKVMGGMRGSPVEVRRLLYQPPSYASPLSRSACSLHAQTWS